MSEPEMRAPFRLVDGGPGGYRTILRGNEVLNHPMLNKGVAFPPDERAALGLVGLLPEAVDTLDEQVLRAYQQFGSRSGDLAKNAFLLGLHDRNETAFYRLVSDHLQEMLPIIYTPTEGAAIEGFSAYYQRPRGVHLSVEDPGSVGDRLAAARCGPEDIDVVVVTDAEQILGIGDQGVGGVWISVAKLMLYTLAAGAHPARTLPVVLDCGTDNAALLSDPLYLGVRRSRVRGERYDELVDRFVEEVARRFPYALLHWEDFGLDNARRNLDRHRDRLPSFNDDMQGTGAVTLAAIESAVAVRGDRMTEQRFIVHGAGTAGTGIADQIRAALVEAGATDEQARRQIWLLDRPGLLTEDLDDALTPYQRPYARPAAEVADWPATDPGGRIGLLDVVRTVRPTVLIGTSTQPRAFDEQVVRAMAAGTDRPVILPLSNPTRLCEADPADLIAWTDGRALVATGSPYPPVEHGGRRHVIAQANNALVFPGIGMGAVVARARTVTDAMIRAAVTALAAASPARTDPDGALLPSIEDVREVSARVAAAVVEQAEADGVARAAGDGSALDRVRAAMWEPRYLPVRPA